MKPQYVLIKEIRDSDTFRISRPVLNDALVQSVRELGMLEKPVLIDDGNGPVPLTCHNRIEALKKLNAESVESYILKSVDPDIFIRNTALKVRRNEVGPAGRCRALLIACKLGIADDPGSFCKSVLNTSSDILDVEFAERILGLPVNVLDYIDIKDAGFKVIKDLVNLPDYMIHWFDRVIGIMQVRVNVFRTVVDHLFDLSKTTDSVALPEFNAKGSDDRMLLENINRMRYPAYSELKDRAAVLIKGLSSRGVSVAFPEFFESGRFTVNVDVGVKDSADDLKSRLHGIDVERLVELALLLK